MATSFNPNTRIAGAFGDSFIVGTPNIDRVTQQLYQEQKQKEAQDKANSEALDNEFAKNLAGVRNPDINELTQKYSAWKQAKIAALKSPQSVTPQQQMEILQKQADMYSTINDSKLQKLHEEGTYKGIQANKDKYEEGAQQKLLTSMQTPVSKLGDLKGYDYSWKGTNYNAGKDMSDAVGQSKKFTDMNNGTVNKNDAFRTDYPVYDNYPDLGNKVYQHYMGIQGKRDAAEFYQRELSSLPPDALTKTDAAYKALPDVNPITGEKKVPLEYVYNSDGKTINDNVSHMVSVYKAQQAVLDHQPTQVDIKPITNEKLKSDNAFKQREIFQQRGFNNMWAMMGEREAQKEKKDNLVDVSSVLGSLNDQIRQGERQQTVIMGGLFGDKKTALTIDDPIMAKVFTKTVGGHSFQADRFEYDKSKKQFYAVFDDHNIINADAAKNIPVPASKIVIPEKEFLTEKAKQLLGTKFKSPANNLLNGLVDKAGGLGKLLDSYDNANSQPQQAAPAAQPKTKSAPTNNKWSKYAVPKK